MRALITAAIFTLLLFSCSGNMQQLETAGTAVKKCLGNCSLSTTSVNDDKKSSGKAEASTDNKQGGVDRIQSIWTNHFNMW